jgi:amino-acid N-acetyltransferase
LYGCVFLFHAFHIHTHHTHVYFWLFVILSSHSFTRYSVQALLKGVRRAHLVAPGNGRLVQEIFTRDGAGTLISRDLYDGIRPATVADVPGILDIIEPLVQEGVLTRRSRKDLEHDVGQYYVFTRDGLIVACGQLRK